MGEDDMRDSRGGKSDETGRGARGLTRREMIRASAVAGAAAWTAPVIIDSLASPASAGSVLATGISHIDVVFRAGSGAPCSLTNGTYYELYWNLNGWVGPGSGNRCADKTHLFSCTGGVSDGPLCLITALNGVAGLITTDSCGCVLLHTDLLPDGVTACINHSRTYCGNTTFNTDGLDDKCAMPCSNSTGTIIRFCCQPSTCCPSSVPAGCTC
jgi:hypothetical protein